ncbi:MAG: T9SS type A sorting domain-containing protein, partial [Bacteroidales bacterium]|nr:T9SS type A sorting domain-containing protein [Bacteroidales bacterium]
TDNPREITVTENTVYVAYFTENPPVTTYTITAVPANPAYGTVTGGGVFLEAEVITIEAIANDGYLFISWDDDNTDNPREITVTEDDIYIASFIPTTRIDENAVSEISVYPNPVADKLNIISSERISELEIVNVLGQIVMHKDVNANNAVCNAEDLPSGMYVVRIHIISRDTSLTNTHSLDILKKFVKE